jgi:hypothetical protein
MPAAPGHSERIAAPPSPAAFLREQPLTMDPVLASMFARQVLRSRHPSGGSCRAGWTRPLREACDVAGFTGYARRPDWFTFRRRLVWRAAVPLRLWLSRW